VHWLTRSRCTSAVRDRPWGSDMDCLILEPKNDGLNVLATVFEFPASGGHLRGQISMNGPIIGRFTSGNPNQPNMEPTIRESLIEHYAPGCDPFLEVVGVVGGRPESFAVDSVID
jgi:hypothetical protein